MELWQIETEMWQIHVKIVCDKLIGKPCIVNLYHVRHLWDGLKWLMFLWITSNCLNDVQNLLNSVRMAHCHIIQRLSSNFLVLQTNDTHLYRLFTSFMPHERVNIMILQSFIRYESDFYFHAVTHEIMSVWTCKQVLKRCLSDINTFQLRQ